jgi:hypothetical protein
MWMKTAKRFRRLSSALELLSLVTAFRKHLGTSPAGYFSTAAQRREGQVSWLGK